MRETYLSFALWSRDPFFEGQQPQNEQKSVIDYIANVDQHKILFPLTRFNTFLEQKFFTYDTMVM